MRVLFSDLHPMVKDADVDSRIDFELRDLARKYNTYTCRWFARVVAGRSLFNRAVLVPTLSESANGEKVGKLLTVHYQPGDSGSIESIADVGGIATFTDTAHGLSDDDVVEINNTQDPVGNDTGTPAAKYDDNDLVVDNKTDDTFDCGQVYSSAVDAARGVWVKEGARSVELYPVDRQKVRESFADPVNPTATDVPEGALILTWRLVPPSIDYLANDTTDLPDWILRSEHHETMCYMAAERATKNFTAFSPMTVEMETRIAADYANVQSKEPDKGAGRQYVKGVYAYENQAQGALIFNPTGKGWY